MAEPRTLDEFGPSTLAALVARLLLDPLSDVSEPAWSDFTIEENSALEVVTRQLGLTIDQVKSSRDLQSRVLSRLNAALSDPILRGERGKQAEQRLGERGDLPLRSYKLVFGDSFQKVFERFGSRRSHVEEVVASPTAVEHIRPSSLHASVFPGITLIAKTITPKKGIPFVTLVETERKGADLVVRAVWRVSADVSTRASHDLLSMLRSFVDEFGVPFSIGHHVPTKFVSYDVIPLEQGVKATSIININAPRGSYYAHTLMKINSLGVVEVALAYVIDTSRYTSYLKASESVIK